MTFKVHRHVVGEDRVVLRVSGQITGDDVNALRALLEKEECGALTLDLKDVFSVDGEAVKLLAVHESNGATIGDCPRYIREWIRREREPT